MYNQTGRLSFLSGILFLAVICHSAAAVQVSPQIRHQEPAVIEGGEELELLFSVPGLNAGNVEDAFLFYRYDSEVSYRQKHASLLSFEFQAALQVDPADQSGFLEYYFEIHLNNGDKITYPSDRDNGESIRVQIVDPRNSDTNALPVDYTILSPEEGETVMINDLIIAITLFYSDEDIDWETSGFRLLLDGRDVTEGAEASNYFFSYAPREVEPGPHRASLLLQSPDTTVEVTSWNFNVVVAEDHQMSVAESGAFFNDYLSQGQLELTAQNQQVGGLANDAMSGNVRLSGQSGNFSYAAHGLITSQEDHRLQPQNRFGAELYIGNWLELEAGHIYPTLNTLTIAGQRLQGINMGLHAFDQAVSLRLLYGKMRRSVSNLYNNVNPVYQESNGFVVDTTYALNLRENGRGTYERDIVGGRLAFGRGEKFRFGLNMLKAEDDTTSISIIRNYSDVLEIAPELTQGLSSGEQQNLEAEPDMLNVNGNPRPKGNFVASTDMELTLDNNRIHFRANGGIGLLNDDISHGPLTYERAEDIGLFIDPDAENLLNRLSWLIIINENMSTLPFRFREEGTVRNADAGLFFPTSVIASQSELGLNYLNNNLRIAYQWVGPDFNSIANTTTRKDIAGITVSDRIRLLQNRIYLTLGYELLNDNVLNHKDATIQTATYRSNISWYPVRRILPRVSAGFMFRTRENGVAIYNPFVNESYRNAALYNFTRQDGQTVIGPDPRSSETYQINSTVTQSFDLFGISHDANLNYSFTNTIDYAFRYGDITSSNYGVMLVSAFEDKPLKTNIGFNYNNTSSLAGSSNITIYGVNIDGSAFLLEDKLNLRVSFAFTKNSSQSIPLLSNSNDTADPFDDYHEPDHNNPSVNENNSFLVSAGGRYDITNNHALQIDLRYNNITSSLQQRSIPNDQLLRARYIFSF